MSLGLEIPTIQRLAHRSGFSLPGITAAVIFCALSQIYSLTQALADVATGPVTCARGGLPAAFHEFSSSARQGQCRGPLSPGGNICQRREHAGQRSSGLQVAEGLLLAREG